MQFGVDHLGHWSLTALLPPALLRTAGARIVTVTSAAHHMGRAVDPANPLGERAVWRARRRPQVTIGTAAASCPARERLDQRHRRPE